MTQEIKVVIVDDELYSRTELKHLLGMFENIKVIGEADSGENGLEKAIRKEPDVVFVDIEMGELSGIQLIESLQKMWKPPLIVLATAYPEYAAQAFRYEVLDYILKPFDEDRLAETMGRIERTLAANIEPANNNGKELGKVAVEDNDRIVYLSPKDIIYFFREEDETLVVTRDHTYRSKMSLKEFEKKLSRYSFFRPHKSYLVNLAKVEHLTPWFNGAYHLKLLHVAENIPVSRNYVKSLRDKLEL